MIVMSQQESKKEKRHAQLIFLFLDERDQEVWGKSIV